MTTRALVTLGLLLLPAVVQAAGSAEHGDHGGGGAWLTLGLSAVNFLVFAFLLRRFTAAPLRDFLGTRRQEVADALADAARVKAEAEAIKLEYEAKAAGLDQARQKLVDEIRAIANADRERALNSAREASERLLSDAERRAESELARARQELRSEAARLAADLASQRITARLDGEQRRRLLDEFLERVEGQ